MSCVIAKTEQRAPGGKRTLKYLAYAGSCFNAGRPSPAGVPTGTAGALGFGGAAGGGVGGASAPCFARSRACSAFRGSGRASSSSFWLTAGGDAEEGREVEPFCDGGMA